MWWTMSRMSQQEIASLEGTRPRACGKGKGECRGAWGLWQGCGLQWGRSKAWSTACKPDTKACEACQACEVASHEVQGQGVISSRFCNLWQQEAQDQHKACGFPEIWGHRGASTVAPKSTKKCRSRKGKAKSPVKGQPAKKSKPSKSKPCKPCPKIVALVNRILSQCKDSECIHPTWSAPKFDPKMFSISVYWTRHAVGVKVAKSFLSGKSCKGKCKGKGKFSQVAYFGSPTPCIYSNLAVAHEFATCMHIRACLFWRGPMDFCELVFFIFL